MLLPPTKSNTPLHYDGEELGIIGLGQNASQSNAASRPLNTRSWRLHIFLGVSMPP